MRLNVGHVEELVLLKGIKDNFKLKKFATIVMVRAQSFEIHVKAVEEKEL